MLVRASMLIFGVVVASCATSPQPQELREPTVSATVEAPYRVLVNCTENHEFSAEDEGAILSVASQWARSVCILPCHAEICATVRKSAREGAAAVYIKAPWWPGPEALITIDSGSVIGAMNFHGQCLARSDCTPR